jgi:hypothetical protein
MACGERNAIDFDQKEIIEEIEIGTVIISTGFKTFDPTRIPCYGYGIYQNVYTALKLGKQYNIPVLLYPQLLGLALGGDSIADLGFNLNLPSTDKLLEIVEIEHKKKRLKLEAQIASI